VNYTPNDGYIDGGEPYTDEELDIMNMHSDSCPIVGCIPHQVIGQLTTSYHYGCMCHEVLTYDDISNSKDDSTGKPHEITEPHIVGSLPHCPQCVVVRKGR